MILDKKRVFLICSIIYILFNYSTGFSNQFQSQNTGLGNYFTLKTSTVWNLDPLIIDDTGGGNYTWDEAVLEPWCTGIGSSINPYIIENLYIDGKDIASCLEIKNSNAYVKIKNCTLFNAGYFISMYYAALKLVNVSNVQMINNDCSNNNGFGIIISESTHINLTGNEIDSNGIGAIFTYDGVVFFDSNNSNIIGNTLILNGDNGFRFENCKNNTIEDNVILQNGGFGITASLCNNFTIYKNTVKSNSWGIELYLSDSNNISENTVEYNYAGVYCEDSDYNIIAENNIKNSTWGIDLYNSNYNNVTGNILVNNEYCITEDLCDGNIIQDNQCLYEIEPGGISGYDLPLLIFLISMISSIIVLSFKKRNKTRV